jgi:hypothetical protein
LLALSVCSCGVEPLNTRAIEERVLDEGYANRMFNYGNYLYGQGRFLEAHAAYLSAENTAYSRDLRDASRVRRVYVERMVAAIEKGKPIPPPPYYKPPPPEPPKKVQVKPLTSDQEKVVKSDMEAAQDRKLQRMYPSFFQPAGNGNSLQETPLGSEPMSQDQAEEK